MNIHFLWGRTQLLRTVQSYAINFMQINSYINLNLENEKGGLEVSLGKGSSFSIPPTLYQKDPVKSTHLAL